VWRAWGVVPDVVLGHGVGEVAAACVAGLWSVEDAARFVVARSNALSTAPPGRMVAVRAEEARVAATLGERDDVALAAVNGPDEVVLSGTLEGVEAVLAALTGTGTIPLPSDRAYHAPQVGPVMPLL